MRVYEKFCKFFCSAIQDVAERKYKDYTNFPFHLSITRRLSWLHSYIFRSFFWKNHFKYRGYCEGNNEYKISIYLYAYANIIEIYKTFFKSNIQYLYTRHCKASLLCKKNLHTCKKKMGLYLYIIIIISEWTCWLVYK